MILLSTNWKVENFGYGYTSSTNNNRDRVIMEASKNTGKSKIYNCIIPCTLKDEGIYCTAIYNEEGRPSFSLKFQKKEHFTTDERKQSSTKEEEVDNNDDKHVPSNRSLIGSKTSVPWNSRTVSKTSKLKLKKTQKKIKHNEKWPLGIEPSKADDLSFIVLPAIIHSSNVEIIKKILSWVRETRQIITTTRDAYGYSDHAALEQMEMSQDVEDLCNFIASSGLPINLMGKRQMFERIKAFKFPEHAEFVENICYFENFDLGTRHSACNTTFYICTLHHQVGKDDIEVIYGLKDEYEVGKNWL